MITIAIVDDHEILRQGVRMLLETEDGFRVVGEAADGLTAVEMVPRVRPMVLILDIALPELNGLEVAREVQGRCPQTRIVVLSMHAGEGYVLQALKNGAAAYVLKDFGAEDLVRAVREALAGRRYLSPPLSRRAVETYVDTARTTSVPSYELLTTREREILQLTAEGYTSSALGERLCISPRTVESHRASVMRKLHLHNQAGLVRFALENRIIS